MIGPAIVTMGIHVSPPAPARANFTATRRLLPHVGVWLPPPMLPLPRTTVLCPKTLLAATNAKQQLTPPDAAEKEVSKKYYFVVANAKFMLDDEEHFQEQLFERRRHYQDLGIERDFWLVIEPKFLDKFPNITRRLARPAVALVSTNGPWITFMKLRLDRVRAESYEADTLEEALASNSAILEFEKPEKWVAPYPKYESGWWEPFLPSGPF
uniref:Ycf54 n=1 Tax=Kalanchoe fedtschenkoi TaxID=63787 RepID=A0A7N0TH97_KALFE